MPNNQNRTNISVPADLRRAMQAHRESVNWSRIAQDAFRRVLSGESESATIQRLSAENEKLCDLLCQIERVAAKGYSV